MKYIWIGILLGVTWLIFFIGVHIAMLFIAWLISEYYLINEE